MQEALAKRRQATGKRKKSKSDVEDEYQVPDHEKKTVIMKSIHREPFPPCAISNVVSHFYIGTRQDQYALGLMAKDKLPVYYDPGIFASSQTQFKIKGYPTVKATFFPKRSQTLTGGVSEDHNRLIAWGIAKYIRKKFDVDVQLEHITTKNIVAHVYMYKRVDLDALYMDIPDRCEYIPECIDCCRITSIHGKPRVSLVFGTGAILLLGSKDMRELEELYVEVCGLAMKHESNDVSGKVQAQRNRQRRAMAHERAIKTTNIEIETAMGMKRRKVSGHAKHKYARADVEFNGDLFEFDTTASAVYLEMIKRDQESGRRKDDIVSPPFCPSAT